MAAVGEAGAQARLSQRHAVTCAQSPLAALRRECILLRTTIAHDITS